MARPPKNSPRPARRSELIYFHASSSFSEYSRDEAWSPAVNVYRMADRVEVCVDLAGVDRQHLNVHVERGLLSIQGQRDAPQPPLSPGPTGEAPAIHIHAMEIDHGPFCRTIDIPDHVDLDRVESEYKDGLLWVRLPLRP